METRAPLDPHGQPLNRLYNIKRNNDRSLEESEKMRTEHLLDRVVDAARLTSKTES